jgi:hypothetical protein
MGALDSRGIVKGTLLYKLMNGCSTCHTLPWSSGHEESYSDMDILI